MKLQVIQPFSPCFGTTYSIGDVIEVDEKLGGELIAAGRAVEGELEPFQNFQPFAAILANKVNPVAAVVNTTVAAVTNTVAKVTKAKNKR